MRFARSDCTSAPKTLMEFSAAAVARTFGWRFTETPYNSPILRKSGFHNGNDSSFTKSAARGIN